MKRVVIALGGNALLRRGEPLEAEIQKSRVEQAARVIAEVAMDREIVITHGNGPQVGLLALQAEAYRAVRAYPLDVLGAESEGMIGYLIEQELASVLPLREACALLTLVEVDSNDPAFESPSKPIGPVYTEEEARRVAAERGWVIARDGEHFRRVVASPEPRRIRELGVIRRLCDAGVIVVCSGGGGIPVVVTEGSGIRGVEAVIDKDRSAALLGEGIGADALVMLTDVDAVYAGWGTPDAKPIRQITASELRKMRFDGGSMGPKVEAACRFVERTGGVAAIGALEALPAILQGEAGTRVIAT